MAAVKNIQIEFFGQGIGPVRTFAGNESVHAFGSGLLQVTSCTACNDADSAAGSRTSREQGRGVAKNRRELLLELRAIDGRFRLHADELAFVAKERTQVLESECRGQ